MNDSNFSPEPQITEHESTPGWPSSQLTSPNVATKITPPPANISYNTQGALKELPHDAINSMD
ncbi:hypothetical protein DSO57_1001953 [Entomophthora muscae]|uniref:Uncharacterized protein n=1 Tax=Entomophthora muscae TaxID=34485 RepID=A0ACC2UUY4_9FUNG|nr:hypothetical protein DSO57_1001953 [Entomophthora muscae]